MFNRFLPDDTDPQSDASADRPPGFPQLTPVDGGDIQFRTRGTIGHIHYLEDENALAYVREKEQFFRIYNGYGFSTELFDTLRERAETLREQGRVPADATLDYILFFVRDRREVLKFTLDQYRTAEHEWENPAPWGSDHQHIVEEQDAVAVWPNGYDYVVKDSGNWNAFTTV